MSRLKFRIASSYIKCEKIFYCGHSSIVVWDIYIEFFLVGRPDCVVHHQSCICAVTTWHIQTTIPVAQDACLSVHICKSEHALSADFQYAYQEISSLDSSARLSCSIKLVIDETYSITSEPNDSS